MKEPLVSIIIPIYNMQMYLEECVRSILVQTYSNLEIILINDGSTDYSKRICDEISFKDKRVKVIHQRNEGVCAARNRGIKESNGEYIAFIDPDDIVANTMVERMVHKAEENKSDVVFSLFQVIDKEGQRTSNLKFPCHESVSGIDGLIIALDEDYGCVLWNKLFRRNVVIQESGEFITFNTTLIRGEDRAWLSQVLPICKRVSFVDEDLYYYRKWKKSEESVEAKKSDVEATLLTQENTKNLNNTKLQEVILKRLYTLSWILYVTAYLKQDIECFEYAKKMLKQSKRKFTFRDYSLMGKTRVFITKILIAMHSSRDIVKYVYMLNR